ncbi:conserved hypothetical protein (plasmid) [Rhodococcus jostii RHA1]|uniref:LGFP repeat-containing protein n=2 Tax=Rhodococcus jostii TaxID=132919 RepID=Q0RVA4_RHOJR|nr:conserved hypothetical protein [Rhodococcus jostii RHA1]
MMAALMIATGGGFAAAQPTTTPTPSASAPATTTPAARTTEARPAERSATSSNATSPATPPTSSSLAPPTTEVVPPPAASSAPTTTASTESSPSAAPTPPANGKKIPYTGKPTENPNATIIPGKMRSDREELPEGFTKEDADKAEIAEAKILAASKPRNARTATTATNAIAAAAPTDCMTYFPQWMYQVCGAIRVKYDSLGGPASFLLLPTSNELVNPDGYGRRNTFQNGPIYWSAASGAHPVVNHFFAAWQRNGWEAGPLGYPTTDEIVNPDGLGRRQEFQNTAAIYWKLNEAYAVRGAVRDKWNTVGAEQGFLGYPSSDELGTPDGIGRFNRFANGAIYWTAGTGAQAMSTTFFTKWGSLGYETGSLGYPIAGDLLNADNVGRRQQFQRGYIYWHPSVGANSVHGRILEQWNTLGSEGGSMGYPVTDEQSSIPLIAPVGAVTQFFQNGSLIWSGQNNEVLRGGWKDVASSSAAQKSSQTSEGSGMVAPMFQSPCPEGTQDYEGAQSAYNCVIRFQDIGGTWINVRAGRGDPNGFGQLHYKTDHQVKDRWVELLLQDSYGVPTNFDAEGTGVTENPDRYRYAQAYYVDNFRGKTSYLITFEVIADFAETNQVSDHTQFGVVTSFCSDPNDNDNIIKFCPQLPTPYL